jgi:hypothetical protein
MQCREKNISCRRQSAGTTRQASLSKRNVVLDFALRHVGPEGQRQEVLGGRPWVDEANGGLEAEAAVEGGLTQYDATRRASPLQLRETLDDER